MRVVKARFDGEKVVLPKDAGDLPSGEVLLIFDESSEEIDRRLWLKGQEQAFAQAWDNDEDAEYDRL